MIAEFPSGGQRKKSLGNADRTKQLGWIERRAKTRLRLKMAAQFQRLGNPVCLDFS
jgi:hypothetical protein